MLNKNDLLESILHECDTAVHLHGKIPAGGLDYRQSEDQRSNLELLRYLSYCGIAGACRATEGAWDGYKEWAGKHGEIPADEFPAAMERQKQALRDLFDGLTDERLDGAATLPWGAETTLRRALVEMPLKWLTAYRMQLFTGIKAAGNTEIWTPDCWAGQSMERPVPATA